MEIALRFFEGLLWFIAFIVLLIFLGYCLRIWAHRNTRQHHSNENTGAGAGAGQGAGNPPGPTQQTQAGAGHTPPSTQQSTSGHGSGHWWSNGWAIAGCVVLALVVITGAGWWLGWIKLPSPPSSGSDPSASWNWYMIGGAIILHAIAIARIAGRGGWAGSTVLAGVVAFWGAVFIYSFLNDGADPRQAMKNLPGPSTTPATSAPATPAVAQPRVVAGEAKWENVPKGTVPVGEWSSSYMLEPGARTEYDAGNCVVYKVRFRLYGGPWEEHKCDKTYPPANEIQFMALKQELTKVPFSIRH